MSQRNGNQFGRALSGRWVRVLLGMMTLFGTYSAGWFVSAGVALVMTRAWWTIVFAGAIAVEFVVVNGPMKSLFRRERPRVESAAIERPGWLPSPRTSAFPSGHASAAVFCSMIWFHHSRVAGFAAVVVAVGVCTSRVAFGYHRLSDVVGGALTGAGLAAAAVGLGLL